MRLRHLARVGRKFAMALLLVYPAWVNAQLDAPSPFDAQQLAKMPEYCKYTQEFRWHVRDGNNPVQIARWQRLMGPSSNVNTPMFEHMHHYCSGVFLINRAAFAFRDDGDAATYLKKSINEFDYVIDRAPDTFVLLPEVLTKKGEALIRLARDRAGIGITGLVEQTLGRAIALKPDYWPAYATLSDFYASIGNKAKAREILDKGIAAAPGAKALTRRLSELRNPKFQ